MKAYVTEIDSKHKYIELTIYNSAKRKQYITRIPKFFLNEDENFDIGDEVTIKVHGKKKK